MDRVRKLITVGSGLNKAWLVYPDLARMHGPLPPHVHWLDIWTAYDSAPAGPVTPPPDGLGGRLQVFRPSREVRVAQGIVAADHPYRPSARETRQARRAGRPASDLVGKASEPGPFWPVSEEVTIRMIVLLEHGLYGENSEQVMVRLASEIDEFVHWKSRYWSGDGALLPHEPRTQALKDTVSDRRRRVAGLAFIRIACTAGALIVAGMGWQVGLTVPGGELADAVADYLEDMALLQPFTAPFDNATRWATSQAEAWAPWAVGPLAGTRALPVFLIGSGLLGLPFWLAHIIFSALWDRHDRLARRLATGTVALAGRAAGDPALTKWASRVRWGRP